ncbi:hypothetical protein ABZX88_03170 [Kitasatospora aureofaciens]|uniref:WXG100-like domain-containing protein n=1 Tax=Kitasatospora aureofaciens TaxID=1894 RepID=UPI000523FD84|nr:hypothetical protein [Kitasatospora aureofaciens]
MAIELPGELVWVMDLLGLPWPKVNEDKVREFAGHVRKFASNIDHTHAEATATLQEMAHHYQAKSYEQMVARWSKMTNDHLHEVVAVCNASATALDAGADAIVAMKLAVIAELGVLAAEAVGGAIATVATLGLASALDAVAVAATRRVVSTAIKAAEEEIIALLITKATEPLQQEVEKAVKGMVFAGVKKALAGVDGDLVADTGEGFAINPLELLALADKMTGHGEAVRGHAKDFTTATAAVSFA